jgi:RNA-binding protein
MNSEIQKQTLDPKLKRSLKATARSLNARIRIGKSGLSKNLHTEIAQAFVGQQLLKLRIERSARSTAKDIITIIENLHFCILVQQVGRVLVFYRDPSAMRQK